MEEEQTMAEQLVELWQKELRGAEDVVRDEGADEGDPEASTGDA